MCPAIALAVFLVVFPAGADTGDFPADDAPIWDIINWFEKTSAKVQISRDPILRQIVCRVAFEPFMAATLAQAFGVPEIKVVAAIGTLTTMKLVKVK